MVERLYELGPDIESDAGATRLAGTAAMAVGAFDLAARFLALSAASLRAQGRLGLLARALALQAWSAAQLADLGAAIPAAAEARRLAQETRQPLIMATADAVQALLAALRGDEQAAGGAGRAGRGDQPADRRERRARGDAARPRPRRARRRTPGGRPGAPASHP